MSETKLKPCPFCGESPVVDESKRRISQGSFVIRNTIICKKCNIGFVRDSEFIFKNGQPDFIRNGYEEAFTLWNTWAYDEN